jgi:endonuclease YncB( thermonuclease family)
MTRDEYLKLLSMQSTEKRLTGTRRDNHDVDTLNMVDDRGLPETIRVAGVDGPEVAKGKNDPGQPAGPQAKQFLTDLIGDHQIRRVGPQQIDVYGRTASRLVLDDGRDVSEELAKSGMAAVPPLYGTEDPNYTSRLAREEYQAELVGKGMWKPSADPVAQEMPWEYRHRIAREQGRERGDYQKQTGIIEDFGASVQQPGNYVRSGIVGLLDPKGTSTQYAHQAFDKQRSTDGLQLQDAVTKRMGFPRKLRFGIDDGKFQWGDIPDEVISAGLEFATDPLSLLTAGPIAKGVSKGVGALATGVGLSEKAAAIAASAAPRTVLGGLYGTGMAGDGGEGDDTSTTKRLFSGVLGAVAAAVAPVAARTVSGMGRTMTDGLVDQYMGWTRSFQNYSVTKKLERESTDTILNNAAAGPIRYSATVLDPLENPDKLKFAEMVMNQRTIEIGERNAWAAMNPNASDAARILSEKEIKAKSMAELRGQSQAFGDHIVKSTEALFVENEKQLGLLNKVRPEGAPEIVGFGAFWPDVYASNADSFNDIAGSFVNQKIFKSKSMERQRSHLVMAVEAFLKRGGSNLAIADAEQAVSLIGRRAAMTDDAFASEMGKQVRPVQSFVAEYLSGKLDLPMADKVQGLYDTQNVYYRKYAKFTVDKAAREAIEAIGDLSQRKVGEGALKVVKDEAGKITSSAREVLAERPMFGPVRVLEAALHKWDVTQAFIVRGQLFGWVAWHKANFFENLTKAYMTGGLAGAADSTMMTNVARDVIGDVFNMAGKNGSTSLRSGSKMDLARAVELGVVSNPAARALGHGPAQGPQAHLQKYIYSESGLARAQEREALRASRSADEKIMDGIGEFLADTSGRVGSTLENTSRFMSWKRLRDELRVAHPDYLKDAVKANQIDNWAADAIKRTYYDYGDVSEFNRLVTKRIAPYASYYMKNIPYYIQAAFDTGTVNNEWLTKATRTLLIENAIRHFGTDPTETEKSGMTDYILGNRPRVLGRSKEGLSVGIMPAFSRDDAIRMAGVFRPGEMLDSYTQKVNPMIKAPLEVAFDKDTFTGAPIRPSNAPKKAGDSTGKSFLFGGGYLPHYAGFPVDVDKRGNPYTESDAFAIGNHLRKAFLPLPALESVATIWGQHAYGKRSVGSNLLNKGVLPIQEVGISDAQMRVQRAVKAKKKEYDDE